MKTSLKTLGVDDGYFPPTYKKSGNKKTLLVAVSCEGVNLTSVRIGSITVDGLDGTSSVLECVKSPETTTYAAIFLDGITYAGFNVVDPKVIYSETSTPVVTVFKHRLDLELIKKALIRNFDDWTERYRTIEENYLNSGEIVTPKGNLLISCVGISHANALKIILDTQNINQYPEALRVADVIASGLTRNAHILNVINQQSRSSQQTL